MKIAVLGGGITGLTAAHCLLKEKHTVSLFEKEKKLGGLAGGFSAPGWDWQLERTYHHLFASDNDIINFAKEIDFDKIFLKSPITASLTKKEEEYNIYAFDTPMDFLRYPYMSILQKLRTGTAIAFLKISPFLKFYESLTAEVFLKKTMGKEVWIRLWEQLFRKKFGRYAGNVLSSFIWARIKKRTKKLAYIKGGFQAFVDYLENENKNKGVKIYKGFQIKNIKKTNKGTFLIEKEEYDCIISTLPTPVLSKIAFDIMPNSYVSKLKKLHYLHAVTLILQTKDPLFDKYYWVNVLDKNIPITVLVQHTNFIDKKYYGDNHILYIGNYVDGDSKLLKMSKDELINYYLTYLRKIKNDNHLSIINSWMFKAAYAQPIFDRGFLENKPDFKSPIKNFYIANLDMTYPYDRGVNYAVKLGKDVSDIIKAEQDLNNP